MFNSLLQTNPIPSYDEVMHHLYTTEEFQTVLLSTVQTVVDLTAKIVINLLEFTFILIGYGIGVAHLIVKEIMSVNLNYKDAIYIYFILTMTLIMSALLNFNIKINAKIIEYQEITKKLRQIEEDIKNFKNTSSVTESCSEDSSDSYSIVENRRYSRRQRRPPLRYNY